MIPLATTTITVRRPDRASDRYRGAATDPVTVVSGLRAGITSDSAATVIVGGQRVQESWVLSTDPADVRDGDLITDEATGTEYVVNWAVPRVGLGLDHVDARIRRVKGAF